MFFHHKAVPCERTLVAVMGAGLLFNCHCGKALVKIYGGILFVLLCCVKTLNVFHLPVY